MTWIVDFHPLFADEFNELSRPVQIRLVAETVLLEKYGPQLSRPHVDTLANSKHSNMKEIRFKAENGVWRVAFAFDPERKAILLVSGNKSGVSQTRFYKELIRKADDRFDDHLSRLAGEKNG